MFDPPLVPNRSASSFERIDAAPGLPTAHAQQELTALGIRPSRDYVRPTKVLRARNQVLGGLIALPIAYVVMRQAIADGGAARGLIALVIVAASVWLAVDSIGCRLVDRVVVAHDRVEARLFTPSAIVMFEIVAGGGVQMRFRVVRFWFRRHHYVDLWWPHDGPRHTIRLDAFAKTDRTRLVGRLRELTARQ